MDDRSFSACIEASNIKSQEIKALQKNGNLDIRSESVKLTRDQFDFLKNMVKLSSKHQGMREFDEYHTIFLLHQIRIFGFTTFSGGNNTVVKEMINNIKTIKAYFRKGNHFRLYNTIRGDGVNSFYDILQQSYDIIPPNNKKFAKIKISSMRFFIDGEATIAAHWLLTTTILLLHSRSKTGIRSKPPQYLWRIIKLNTNKPSIVTQIKFLLSQTRNKWYNNSFGTNTTTFSSRMVQNEILCTQDRVLFELFQ
jgi:hypothetical protein